MSADTLHTPHQSAPQSAHQSARQAPKHVTRQAARPAAKQAAAQASGQTAHLPADSVTLADSLARADSLKVLNVHEAMVFDRAEPLFRQEPRDNAIGFGDSWLMIGLLILMVAIGLKFRNSSKFIASLLRETTNTRRRHNVFDDTVRESSFLLLLNVVALLSGGLLLYLALTAGTQPELPAALATMGVTLLYGLFIWVAYCVTGWIFSDSDTMHLWVRGHTAAQGLLSILLLPLALASVVDPPIAPEVAWVAAGVFLVAKMLFIFKGARIFLHGFSSIMLFFYYLCSLEIVPLVLVYIGVKQLLAVMG